MKRIIITERSYKPLIEFFTFIVVFLAVRNYFVITIEKINSKRNLLDYKSIDFSERSAIIYNEINDLSVNFGATIALSSFIILLFLSSYFKTIKHKAFIFVCEVVLVWTIFSSTTTEMKINVVEDDKYYLSLLIFIPFLYIIYHSTIVGKNVDITEKVKQKETSLHQDKISDLEQLLKLDLINEIEFESKKEFHLKKKIKAEITDTEEYYLLLKTKEKGLLSEEEFVNKLDKLVELKYSDK